MNEGFIVEYNSNTKIGFAKIRTIENLHHVFTYVFFNLNYVSGEVPLELSTGDVISIYQFISPRPSIFDDSSTLKIFVTKIDLLTIRTAKLYTFAKEHIPNLLIANDKNEIIDIVLKEFDLNRQPDYNILTVIDLTKKRSMIKAYLDEDIYTGDSFLKSIVDEYVNSINFNKIVNENLNVKYGYDISSKKYGGRDYTMYSYNISYNTEFIYQCDFYIGSLYSQHRYDFAIKEDYSDDVYVDFYPEVVEFINEHKAEMESFCKSKTIELRNDLITKYSKLEHSRLLYSHFRAKIINQLLRIKNCKEKTDDYWQYSETIKFFKKYKLAEDITDRYKFQDWLNMTRDLSKNDRNYSLILDKDIHYYDWK